MRKTTGVTKETARSGILSARKASWVPHILSTRGSLILTVKVNNLTIYVSSMHHRKDVYAKKLGLAPLSKEGGYFKETFRSPERISTLTRDGGERNVFTTIYYMISPELGGKNFLHSNKSDNVHYFHDGWPAKYILVSPEGEVTEYVLGRDVAKGHVLQLRVPGGFLKAGKIVEEEDYATFPGEIPFTLISEHVSPGFDYKDRHVPGAKEVKTTYPELWHKLEEYIAP